MKVIIKGARGAFLNLWEPKQFNGTGEARCNGNFLLDPAKQKAEVDKVVAAIQEVAREKWGAKAPDVLKTLKAKGDLCLHPGETKSEYDGFEGMVFVSAANKARPVVVDKDKTPLTQSDGKPYSGCYVNVSVDIWAQDNNFGKRINAKLLAVQFHADGDAFSGGEGYTDDDFEDEAGGEGGGSNDDSGGDFFQ